MTSIDEVPMRNIATVSDVCHLVHSFQLSDACGDGGTYTGVILQSTGLPDGVGHMEYDGNEKTYSGNWSHGRWHGSGKVTYENGHSYEGEFQYDQRHGKGKYIWLDGGFYEGDFQFNKEHGKGMMVWPDGAKCIGEFNNGTLEVGRYSFP
jgi:hypothetical protein